VDRFSSARLLSDNLVRQQEATVDTRRNIIAVGFACALALLLTGVAFGVQGYEYGKAHWEPDGVPVCLAAGLQGAPHVTTDGAQGVIVAWVDCRPSLADCDIYAQRVGADGSRLWQPDGTPVNSAQDVQFDPRVVSDGDGGALVAWSDYRNHTDYSVFAQRLDSAGNRLWASDGITVAAGIGHQTVVQLVPDGSGGAFVVWEEWQEYPDTDTNLFARRLDTEGTLLWSMPTTITVAPHEQYKAKAATDGAGGLLVTWGDLRDPDDSNIYAQRISTNGAVLWEPNGVLVSPDPTLQRPGLIAPDGTGGAYVAWYDFRANPNQADTYMQRLTANGMVAWTSDLPAVVDPTYADGPDDLIPDGSSGAIVVASRCINGAVEVDVLAQRVNSDGEFLWGSEPVNVTPWEKQQQFAVAAPDNQGGAYIAWIDKYTDSFAYDVWTQHLGADGTRLWLDHGVQAVGADGPQDLLAIISDGDGGFIVAWRDRRDGLENPDLYAQRITGDIGTRYFLPLIQKNRKSRITVALRSLRSKLSSCRQWGMSGEVQR